MLGELPASAGRGAASADQIHVQVQSVSDHISSRFEFEQCCQVKCLLIHASRQNCAKHVPVLQSFTTGTVQLFTPSTLIFMHAIGQKSYKYNSCKPKIAVVWCALYGEVSMKTCYMYS